MDKIEKLARELARAGLKRALRKAGLRIQHCKRSDVNMAAATFYLVNLKRYTKAAKAKLAK